MSDSGMGPARLDPVLHILSPVCTHTPASMVTSDLVATGDWIADLRGFPTAAYEVGAEGYVDVTDSLPARPDAWTAAREWLAEFTGKTGLQDILSVDGYGFWWTLNGQRFVAGLTELGNVLAWIDLLLAIRDHSPRFRCRSVLIHGQHEATALVATQVWPELQIQVVLAQAVVPPAAPEVPPRRPGQGRRAAGQGWTVVPRRVGLLMVRTVFGFLYLVYAWLRRPEICLFTETNLLRTVGGLGLDRSGAGRRLRDVYLGDVAEALRIGGWRVAVAEKHGANASWEGFRARGWFFPTDLVFLLAAAWSAKRGFPRRIVRRWQARWREVQPTVVSHLRYRGIDIAPLALPLVAREFTSHAPNLETLVRIWRALFKLWRPRLVYVNNAYGRGSVPAIIAAKGLKIPTIEQQHGLIGRNHIAYLVPRHLDLRSEFPLCDTMAVWGAFTRRFLVDAGVYEPDGAVVCGFPRADLLLGQLPSRAETRARLGIPEQASVVLYTSNAFAQDAMSDILDGILREDPHPSPLPGGEGEEPGREGLARPDRASSTDVGAGLVHWLIKLHPRETTRHLWEAALAERGLPATQPARVQRSVRVLEGGVDFYALLAACDVHVSFASTTLIEAAILGKPNLGLDIAHASDPAGYREARAFLPVAPAELGSVVHGLLTNPERREQLLAEQKAFAEDWCVHDGHAVDRIVALLEASIVQSGQAPSRGQGPGQRARDSECRKEG